MLDAHRLWKERAMSDDTVLDHDLTEAQILVISKIIGNIPIIALPRGGMGFARQPETLGHVVEVLVSVADHLRDSMRESNELRGQLDRENRKKAIAGGYLRELLTAGGRSSTEVVHHTKAGALGEYIGYTTDWQERRWSIGDLQPGVRPNDVRIALVRTEDGIQHTYELTVTRNAPVDIYPPEGE
jgi:hypothetical protein